MPKRIINNIMLKDNFIHPSTNSKGNWTEKEDEQILRYVRSMPD